MTKKQKAIVASLCAGKTPLEISRELGITKQNVYTTCNRMRTRGTLPKLTKPPLTEKQKAVLCCYASNVPITTIAKTLGVTCQTVMAHAHSGFKRLGLTTRGEDRIAKLRAYFAGGKPAVTMDDSAFN